MCKLCIENNNEFQSDLLITESALSALLVNLFPIGKYSLIVIPKRHVYSMSELSDLELTDFFNLVRSTTNSIKAKFKPDGINVFTNEGELAGQTIKHLHFHIVPRFKNDGIENFKRGSKKTTIEKKDLDKIKKMILK